MATSSILNDCVVCNCNVTGRWSLKLYKAFLIEKEKSEPSQLVELISWLKHLTFMI